MGVVMQRRQNDPTCCLFLHVRTGTIFIGMFHLVMQMIAMVFIGYMIVFFGSSEVEVDVEVDVFNDLEYKKTTSDMSVALVITFCMFIVTCMMICGALKHRAGYLLPFFCLQLFDFVLSCLTAIGWFTYYPENDEQSFPNNIDWFKYNNQMKLEDYGIDGQWTILIFLILFLGIMTVKAYFISCVWACYKYIVCRDAVQMTGTSEDTEALLAPPAYATVVKLPPDVPTPPPYQP
ncbi:lysosomal-associated transmembrane protein 4A-like [Saccoglossus kowalevskii]|uniref:Lysosomal-associated transmembrane protein 4A-like n=1 Tax=Saccoglossus kowalevskii TaxID=10224 RepID=A0ABM0GXU7_SACKO|nr:PREDICTED: lysosomal-associated transmembrane protein 4A-like [Saccoglossus kowalevskii]